MADALSRRPDFATSSYMELNALTETDKHLELQQMLETKVELPELKYTDDPDFGWVHQLITSKLKVPRHQHQAVGRFQLNDGVLYFGSRICIPQIHQLRYKLISEYHDALNAGHPGRTNTYNNIIHTYYWPRMWEQESDYVRRCPTC